MDKVKKSKLGFTLVELMTAALAFAVLSLAVGSMLVYGWMGWVRNNELVAMQRDSSLAMMMISKEVRNAQYADISDGSGISITRLDGSVVSFNASGNNIVRNDGMVVVDGWLVPGTFITYKVDEVSADTGYKINQWVQVDFDLSTATATESYSIKVSPRNGS